MILVIMIILVSMIANNDNYNTIDNTQCINDTTTTTTTTNNNNNNNNNHNDNTNTNTTHTITIRMMINMMI